MIRGLLACVACSLLPASAVMAASTVVVSGARISIAYTRDSADFDQSDLQAWVRNAAQAVATYYGRFPVSELRILVTPAAGRGIGGGRAWAHDGALIRIRVGAATTADDYARDWVLVHEMTHLALPALPEAHEWLEEGIATYVESLARAQAGQLNAKAVWAGFVRGMPNGLPQAGDRGLDYTHTWGRTYWGGALFSLLADIEIRRRTGNRHGLQDALRAILAAGNMETSSRLPPLLEIGDRAVGVPVLSELYARHRNRAERVDLDSVWRQLGVQRDGRSVRLDEAAPEAAIRRSMTARRHEPT